MKIQLAAATTTAALIVIFAISLAGSDTIATTQEYALPVSIHDLIPLEYYIPDQFKKSLTLSKQLTKKFPEETIQGGIVPHDLLHGEYIVHFFKELQQQNPSTIILIGPNHFERGPGNILTTLLNWQAPSQTLNIHTTFVQQLVQLPFIEHDPTILQHEHSIAGIVPYISHFLPETQLVPIILKAETTLQEINNLSHFLNTNAQAGTVIVASVDFSHYLTAREAEQKDIVSEQALRTLDYQTIQSFGPRFNDYLDSPASISLLMQFLELNGVEENIILYNSNSGILSKNYDIPVTSYFEMIYY